METTGGGVLYDVSMFGIVPDGKVVVNPGLNFVEKVTVRTLLFFFPFLNTGGCRGVAGGLQGGCRGFRGG